VARSPYLQRKAAAGDRPELGPLDPTRTSRVWARAAAPDGREAAALLELGEGYAFSAESAVRAIEAVLAAPVPGAFSPGALLGADFALSVPGTRRFELTVPTAA